MRRWRWLAIGALALSLCGGGCVTQAPDVVRESLAHQLEDIVACEAEVLPLVPADATITFTTVSGQTVTRPARATWQELLRGMLFRGAGLKAWADGGAYDPVAAFAKLFPDRVDIPAGDVR
jgi:hypothetical protein